MLGIRSLLLGAILDPVVFISLIGPLLISGVLGLITGQVLMQPTQQPDSPLRALLINQSSPGFADYVIQYYTAVMALVFGFVRHIFPVISKKNEDTSGVENNHTGLALYQIYSVAVLVFSGLVLSKLAVNFHTLELYTKHTTQFGFAGLPPMKSWLTWVRFAIAASGIWHSRLKAAGVFSA